MKTTFLILAAGVILFVIVRTGFRASTSRHRGWRVGHVGRDGMYYEELVDGKWQRIPIDGEMLVGPAHHIIYFASEEARQEYPAWARDRRPEIVARIKTETLLLAWGPPGFRIGSGHAEPRPAKAIWRAGGAAFLSIRYGQRHTRELEARFVNITCSPLQIRSSRVHVPLRSSPVCRRCSKWYGQPIPRGHRSLGRRNCARCQRVTHEPHNPAFQRSTFLHRRRNGGV